VEKAECTPGNDEIHEAKVKLKSSILVNYKCSIVAIEISQETKKGLG
jgi:hypothetical protein